jgi:hypothetical protein
MSLVLPGKNVLKGSLRLCIIKAGIFRKMPARFMKLVEAAGIEPASENLQPKAHTCLSPLLQLSLPPAPQGKLRDRPAR